MATTARTPIQREKTVTITFDKGEPVLSPDPFYVSKQASEEVIWVCPSGDYFTVHYTNIVRNVHLPDSEFKPRWPHGTSRVKLQG